MATRGILQHREPEVHELAELFPAMTPEEYEAFKADVEANGLRDPITTSEGKVVDGVHRLRACRELGVEPRFVEWDGVGSLLSFVVARNMHRRHLTEAQRAMLAARIANLGRGRPANNARERAVSQAEAARMAKVGRTAVQEARKVQRRGVFELARAVERGEVPLAAAARVAELDATEQAEVVARGPAAVKERASHSRRDVRVEAREADGAAYADVEAVACDARPLPGERDGGVEQDVGVPAVLLDPRADREWLERLPLRAALRDPAAFDREALAWRRVAPLLEEARRRDTGFDDEMRLRRSRTWAPQVLANLAGLDHPDRWKSCARCLGSGGGAGSGPCPECRGDGYMVTRRAES